MTGVRHNFPGQFNQLIALHKFTPDALMVNTTPSEIEAKAAAPMLTVNDPPGWLGPWPFKPIPIRA